MPAADTRDLCSRARELLSAGSDGRSAVRSLSQDMDHLLSAALEEASAVTGTQPELALVAAGGYGRQELAPFSDVDIMLLSRDRSAHSRESAQSFLYRLWDLGLDISHSFRTLKDCVEDSMKDLKTRTLLIDSRLVAGSGKLFSDFKRDVYEKLLFKGRKTFISDMLRDAHLRHRMYGNSLNLLEPHIKEGQGGLRDIHCIGWLRKVVFRGAADDRTNEVMSPRVCDRLARAHDFLLRVRVLLHCATGRKNEVLSYEHQEEVARSLGLRDTRRFYSAELLMRRYYRETRYVTEVLSRLSQHAGRRYFALPFGLGIRKVSEDFYIAGNEITCRDGNILADPGRILDAFHVFARTGARFSWKLKDVLKARALTIERKVWTSKTLSSSLLGILRSGRVYETLSEMHDCGVLGRMIPEFGRLRHLVVYEVYHRYTVDEHSLLAIRNLEMLINTKELKLGYLSAMLKSVNRELLYLSILLHDIGKGVSKRHEEAGYRLIRDVVERFDMREPDKRMVKFLVRNHIALARLALTRDADAPETVTQAAGIVETEERLKALYLVTYADMTAVNPQFWSEWKAVIFHELYERILAHLSGGAATLREFPDEEIGIFARDMPGRYLIAETQEAIREDCALVKAVPQEGVSVSFRDRSDGTLELTVAARDKPGLFARIVGIMSTRGLNVMRARLYTGATGAVVDRIQVSNWKDLWWEGLEEDVRRELMEALLSETWHPVGGPQRGPGSSVLGGPHQRRFEQAIEVDNESSETHTLIELSLPDRVGLLYDISRQLHSFGVDIATAVINTEDGVAQDVFYVQQEGAKLSNTCILELVTSLSHSEMEAHAIS